MPSLVENLTILLNGLTYGMVLVLVSMGLSLIFGLMGVLNFAHGALFMLGAYVGLSVMKLAGAGIAGFGVALIAAPVIVAVVGAALERTVFRPLYDTDPIYQLLLTFGLAVVLEEVVKLVWGESPPALPPRPAVFDGQIALAGVRLPYYRAFVLVLGSLAVVATALFLSRTRYGLVVRAGVYDDQKAATLGLNVRRAFTVVFAIGSMLAALGGVTYIYRTGINTGLGASIILPAFIVVIVGGLGSFRGSVIAALLIGIVWQFTAVYVPILTGAITFLVMLSVLLWRPQGLLGEAEVEV